MSIDHSFARPVSKLPTVTANRYVQPLREGGSLPAIVDTDEAGMFVVKFRGAGQGAKALVAELIVGGIAMALGLDTPELALVDVVSAFGRSEPDPEIQELLRRSHGLNVGLRYLDGAFNFEPGAAGDLVSPEMAAMVVWLDAYVTNPDRTHRNPNLLIWQRQPWLIDHGAALYAHHDWASVDEARTRTRFPLIKQHVLLAVSGDLGAADAAAARALTEPVLARVLAGVPDDLFLDGTAGEEFATAAEARERYLRYLVQRLAEPRAFVDEAITARELLLREPPRALKARR